jgi:hypothetical protein
MTDPTAESTPGAEATPATDDLRFPKFEEPTVVDPFSLPDSTQPDYSAPSDLWDLPKPAAEPTTTSYPGLNYQAQAAYGQPDPATQPSQPTPAAQSSGYPHPAAYAQPTGYPQAPYGQTAGYPQPASSQTGYPEPSGYPGYGQSLSTQQQPYGYGYPMAPDHPSSTVVLVLGLIGMFVFPLTAPFAWVLGSRARAEIAANPGRWGSSSALTVGWVLGIITSVIWLLMITLGVVAVLAMVPFMG